MDLNELSDTICKVARVFCEDLMNPEQLAKLRMHLEAGCVDCGTASHGRLDFEDEELLILGETMEVA